MIARTPSGRRRGRAVAAGRVLRRAGPHRRVRQRRRSSPSSATAASGCRPGRACSACRPTRSRSSTRSSRPGRPLARWIRRDDEDWRLTAAPRVDPETAETYGVAFHLRARSDMPILRAAS